MEFRNKSRLAQTFSPDPAVSPPPTHTLRPPVNHRPEPSPLLDYIRILNRSRVLIALCMLLGILASLLFHLTTLPVYSARTSLQIQSPKDRTSSAESPTDLLRSDTLLDRTVNRLASETHPVSIQRNDLASQLKRLVRLPAGQPLTYGALLEGAARHVGVESSTDTSVLHITCNASNAAFAAKFCNTLTQEFKDEVGEIGSSGPRQTDKPLTPELADARLRAEESQKKLDQAAGTHGTAFIPEQSPREDRLEQIQAELVKAQLDRIEQEATPGVKGPGSATGSPAADVDAAGHREALLRAAYNAQIATMASDKRQAALINELRREANTDEQLYRRLLSHSGLSGTEPTSGSTTIRVIEPALVPRFPVSPRCLPAAAIGLLLGSALGIGLAFLLDRRSHPMPHLGNTSHELQPSAARTVPHHWHRSA